MAFKPIQAPDIVNSLIALDPSFRRSQNLVKCLTVGLTDCYSRIALQSVSPSRAVVLSGDSSYTDLEQIGYGAFSVVTRACDAYGQVYAVKRVGSKFLLLALREMIFLRFLQLKTCRGGDFFLNLVDAHSSGDSVCLVLGLCQCTLLDCITDLRTGDGEQEQQEGQQGSSLMFADDVVRPLPRLGDGREVSVPRPPPLPPQKRVLGPCFVRRLRHIATSLVSALSVLKTEGVIHADIKPENIFLQFTDTTTAASADVDGHSSTHSEPDLLSSLPSDDFVVRVGDFGNAFHKSETSKFYDDFSIQSLPYRSPEVLMGVPFGDKIDMWSLGVVLLELCTGCTLFAASTREELFAAMCETFSAPPSLLFAGGRFTAELLSGTAGAAVPTRKPLLFADHVARIYRIIASYGVEVGQLPGSLFHFLAALTHMDPDQRLNASEAMQHEFLTCKLCLPIAVMGGRVKQQDRMFKSLSVLRSPSIHSSSASSRSASNGAPTASRIRNGSEHRAAGGETLGKRGMENFVDLTRAEHKHDGYWKHE